MKIEGEVVSGGGTGSGSGVDNGRRGEGVGGGGGMTTETRCAFVCVHVVSLSCSTGDDFDSMVLWCGAVWRGVVWVRRTVT